MNTTSIAAPVGGQELRNAVSCAGGRTADRHTRPGPIENTVPTRSGVLSAGAKAGDVFHPRPASPAPTSQRGGAA